MVQSLLSSLHVKVLTDGLFWVEVNGGDGSLMPRELDNMATMSGLMVSSAEHSRVRTL